MCRSAKPPEGFRDVRDGRAPARGGRVSPTGSYAVSAQSTIAATIPAAVIPPTGQEVASTTLLRGRFCGLGCSADALEQEVRVRPRSGDRNVLRRGLSTPWRRGAG